MSYVLSEEELGHVRLGILLPKDTIAKLDLLKDKGMFASRGRTIEALVDAILEIQKDANVIMKRAKQEPALNANDFGMAINPWLMDILRRVFVFGE
jgi:hypothetical protein